MVDQRSWVHVLSVISRGFVWEIDIWVLPALRQRLKGWEVSLSVLRPCSTLHQIGLHGCRPRKKASSKDNAKESPQTVYWRQADQGLLDYWNHVLWSDETKINLSVAATRWGVQRQVCLAYSQAWWWECHVLGLHECWRYWEATVHWGNHECQHVLWHPEAEHDPLPLETGPQGSISTW